MTSSATELAEVQMPQMGVSVAEGTITSWRKRPGDWVERDEVIVEISTDKVETEVPSPAAGRVAELLVQEGDTVDVGTLLATIDAGAKPGRRMRQSRPIPGLRRAQAVDSRQERVGSRQGTATARRRQCLPSSVA